MIVSSQECPLLSSKFHLRSLIKLKFKINQAHQLFCQANKDSISKLSRTWLSRSNLRLTLPRLAQMVNLSLCLLTSRRRYSWPNKQLPQTIRLMIKTKILLWNQNKRSRKEIWLNLQLILQFSTSMQRYVNILILVKEEIPKTILSNLVRSRKTTMGGTSKSFSLSWTWMEMGTSYHSTLSKVNRTIFQCLIIYKTCRVSMGSTTLGLALTVSVGLTANLESIILELYSSKLWLIIFTHPIFRPPVSPKLKINYLVLTDWGVLEI